MLLGLAVISPLASFVVILLFGPRMGKHGEYGAYVAISAIGFSCLLSFIAMFGVWLPNHAHELAGDGHGGHSTEQHGSADEKEVSASSSLDVVPVAYLADKTEAGHATATGEHANEEGHAKASSDHGHGAAASGGHGTEHDGHGEHDINGPPTAYTGVYYLLGKFGDLRLEISYYIDSVTLCMFCMVTLIATLIHFYASGYMHDELHDITDHEVTLTDGSHLKRPGRFPRFFQYLSLFSFSMLGLVLAGNIAMVFVFWELVGVCSYFLIGFYIERKSASTAANKAFIVNRVGDFGMLIGLMALWSGIGTFSFGDIDYDGDGVKEKGLFSTVRPAENDYALTVPDRMVLLSARDEVDQFVSAYRTDHPNASQDEVQAAVLANVENWRDGSSGTHYGHWLLVIAGIGIFCGCVGKSAQFPLHVWLPDAMEGPTPVSALVHSATMVAAGVYLVGRFYPVFPPEALLVIAIAGCITLFMAASIALTATDIKRVLAYSTVSQLGYMMLALGVGGWLAGMMHLITHAFFKSLLFMCSGSVIHAVHTNEMPEMGGLRKKMPVTAYTMLVGCMAIAGVSIPFVVGFSGYYSKDAILEQAFSLLDHNESSWASIFFVFAAGGAAMTAFYMFRMWYLTFAGTPRNQERYDHAHESPRVMYMPLVILSVFAVCVAWAAYTDLLIGAAIAVLVGILAMLLFKSSSAGHDSHSVAHGHDSHGHGDHGHNDHGHDEHGSHGHEAHGHHGGQSEAYLRYLILGLGVLVLVIGLLWMGAGWQNVTLASLLEQSRPVGTTRSVTGVMVDWTWPDEHLSHVPEIKVPVTLLAFGTAMGGIALATVMYGFGWLSPSDVRRQFSPIYSFLIHKWWFDELYDFLFVRPTHVIGRMMAGFDKNWLDWLIDGSAKVTIAFSNFWERLADQTIVDGTVNVVSGWLYSLGVSLHRVQTGKLRQYIVFIAVGAIAIFLLVSFFWSPAQAVR
ncbi:MAG: proton-conducting transporter membrane subunit [Pirellulaceae bacterium]